MNFFKTDNKTALEAKQAAQWIAFAPVVFQAARTMRNNGILQCLHVAGLTGVTIEDVEAQTGVSHYGVRVLLEAGLGIGLCYLNEQEKYVLTKTGYFILADALTTVNLDFVHDVCYEGMFNLDKSIDTGKPEGLKVFGEWNTVYEALSQLPKRVQESWFAFDHFYSDAAFPVVAKHVFDTGVKNIIDIGGNTGKWAITCANYAPDIKVTIMDLPGQLNMAQAKIQMLGLQNRIHFHAVNILDESQQFPRGYDAIWMSQFLDCFSDNEITSILKRCYSALDENGYVFIMETFWDRQRFDTASFCLQMTSLYFTNIANGNSQMYHADVFKKCVNAAGLEIIEEIDNIGLGHTLLKCKKQKAATL